MAVSHKRAPTKIFLSLPPWREIFWWVLCFDWLSQISLSLWHGDMYYSIFYTSLLHHRSVCIFNSQQGGAHSEPERSGRSHNYRMIHLEQGCPKDCYLTAASSVVANLSNLQYSTQQQQGWMTGWWFKRLESSCCFAFLAAAHLGHLISHCTHSDPGSNIAHISGSLASDHTVQYSSTFPLCLAIWR